MRSPQPLNSKSYGLRAVWPLYSFGGLKVKGVRSTTGEILTVAYSGATAMEYLPTVAYTSCCRMLGLWGRRVGRLLHGSTTTAVRELAPGPFLFLVCFSASVLAMSHVP